MIPGRITNATLVLGAPEGWDAATDLPCGALPVREEMIEGVPFMVSAWMPSTEEIAAIRAGAPVILHIQATRHPVVALGVGEAPDETLP